MEDKWWWQHDTLMGSGLSHDRYTGKIWHKHDIQSLGLFLDFMHLLCIRICDTNFLVVVVVINPPLPRDGGTVRAAIQDYAVNPIEIRLGDQSIFFATIIYSSSHAISPMQRR